MLTGFGLVALVLMTGIVVAFLSIIITMIEKWLLLGNLAADSIFTLYRINVFSGLITIPGLLILFLIFARLFEALGLHLDFFIKLSPILTPEFLLYPIYLVCALGYVLVKSVLINEFFEDKDLRRKIIRFNFLTSFIVATGIWLWHVVIPFLYRNNFF